MITVTLDPASFFAALADPTRLALVRLLASLPSGHQLCVRALALRMGVSQPAVSQHLQVLRGVGLVHGERSGPKIHYRLDREQLLAGEALLREIAGATRLPDERLACSPEPDSPPADALPGPGR